MSKKIQDTYFLNPQVAFEEAKKQNKLYINGVIESTQICYYDGIELKDTPYNCINVPIKNLIEYFSITENRFPTNINVTNSSISTNDELIKLKNSFIKIMKISKDNMINNIINISNKIKELKPNFNDKILRVYIGTCRETTVMQYVSKNIASAFENLGYKVFVTTQKDDIKACSMLKALKDILNFNPHIIVNINHINNQYLNNNIFNFIWFQDAMPILKNNERIILRKRDYIFSLVKEFDKHLDRKNIDYQRQSFCLNNNIYKKYKHIKREKKIVFIGSSYYSTMENKNIDKKVFKYLEKLLKKGISFTEELTNKIAIKFNIDRVFLDGRIIPYIIRDITMKWLCSIKSNYKIEIYGWGWDRYEETKPYYKGSLKYGEDIAKVYNSATYVFSPHQTYFLQQRIFEGAGCGAIPIVYDIRDITDEDNYEEAFLFFKTKKDLKKILSKKKPIKKDLTRLLEENSYNNFANKMIKIVEENKYLGDINE